jgi:hypothetical protein
MGLLSSIGAIVGNFITPGVGGAIGGTLGALLEGGGKKDTQMDAYTAYKIQQEKEWEATYGPIEKNLVAHYEHLNTSSVIAKGNDALEQQYKAALDRANKQIAARGLDVKGGIGTSIMADSLNMLAKQKAQLQATADDYIAQQQQQFYASMRPGKTDASIMVQANSTAQYKQQAYNDKMLSQGVAAGIDLGNKIYTGITGEEIPDPTRKTPTIGGLK